MKSTFSTNRDEPEAWEHEASAKVNVKELTTTGSVGQVLSVPLKKSGLDLPLDEENILKSYQGDLKLVKLEEEILAKFVINYSVETICARCLKVFERSGKIEFENQYWFNRQKDSPENEIVDKNYEIEVGKSIYEEIYFDIPMKPLCDKECKGLDNR